MLNAVEFSPYPTDVLARTCEHAEIYMKPSLMFVYYKQKFHKFSFSCISQYKERYSGAYTTNMKI